MGRGAIGISSVASAWIAPSYASRFKCLICWTWNIRTLSQPRRPLVTEPDTGVADEKTGQSRAKEVGRHRKGLTVTLYLIAIPAIESEGPTLCTMQPRCESLLGAEVPESMCPGGGLA